jgi:hypothetical protein
MVTSLEDLVFIRSFLLDQISWVSFAFEDLVDSLEPMGLVGINMDLVLDLMAIYPKVLAII